METIEKIVFERIWVTEYQDHCPLPENDVVQVDNENIFGVFPMGIKIHKNYEWVFKNRYLDVEKTLKDFGNPLCRVEIIRSTVCLEEDENKVSLKFFKTIKKRSPGCVWFSRNSDMHFITYNKKTKNFYSGHMSNYNKKKKSRKVRCNHFFNHMNMIYSSVIPFIKQLDENVMEDEKNLSIEKVNKIYSKFYSILGIKERSEYFDITSDLYFKYLTDKQFKIPNNFLAFKHSGNKPPARLFKKNDNKLVETYMQFYGIRGDKFRKILHKVKKIDFFEIQHLIKLFGIDFLTQRPEDELLLLVESPNSVYAGSLTNNETTNFFNSISKKEKLNFYKTILAHFGAGNGLYSISDHIKFYSEISKYEKVKWNSFNIKTFQDEHVIFSDKYSFYTKGHYEREYDENFLDYIQQPFIVEGIRYTPHVLQSNNQYIDESSHQSNCVKTYNSNIGSIIISLRNEYNERLTMQFTPKKTDEKVIWKNWQTRARFNENPSEKWKPAIATVENKLSHITNFQLPKLYYINFNSKKLVDLNWNHNGNISALQVVKNEFDFYDII